MEFYVSILQNLALLSFIGIGILTAERMLPALQTAARKTILGIILGVSAFLVTSAPITLPNGATVDARAGPVIISALVAGPWGALIAATIGGSARTLIGGGFAFSGTVAFFLYALFGWLLVSLHVVNLKNALSLRGTLAFCLASYIGAFCVFFLIQPPERAMIWLQDSLPNILVANTLSIFFTIVIVDLAFRIQNNFKQTLETNETLRLAKRAGGFGVWEYDIKADRLHWDNRCAEIHGVSVAEKPATYQGWQDLVHPGDTKSVEQHLDVALKGEVEDFEVEYRTFRPGSDERVIMANAIVLRATDGTPARLVGTNLDLTSIRKTEAELTQVRSVAAQAQRFDTIGKLTGGVAHDFNNLLAVVMGNLELLQEKMKADAASKDTDVFIDSSIQAVQRGAELTTSMLAYARQARLEPTVVDINQVVRETERWMARTIQSNIQIETVLQAGAWQARVDRSSLQSALVNLIVNARDAMPDGGKLTIETANVKVDDTYILNNAEDIPAGRYILVAVSDDGGGISKDMHARIFEPFFTTKPVGKGTGLGLSMVEGFVRQSGGTIHVYSEPGIGTSFKMYFQALAPDELAAQPRSAPAKDRSAALQTKAKILVVEDNPEVLRILQKSLSSSGYTVTTAENGDAAYALFEKDQDFDVVLTDIVMPGELQGPGLAAACRALVHDVPFIFLSGYASEATVHGNGLHPDDIRLMKPVSKADLLMAVSKRLVQRRQ